MSLLGWFLLAFKLPSTFWVLGVATSSLRRAGHHQVLLLCWAKAGPLPPRRRGSSAAAVAATGVAHGRASAHATTAVGRSIAEAA